jgi:hypothetical protein
MANDTQSRTVRTVVPVDQLAGIAAIAETSPVARPGFRPIFRQWAPAWFYSALCWLGQSYSDASNIERSFGTVLAGANVDPYRQLGATRLFVIQSGRDEFRLTIAVDIDSDAALNSDSTQPYQRTDAGILQMYQDLAASAIFPAVTHAYVAGNVNLVAELQDRLQARTTGYDPACGLRRILLGSAIAQVVPLSDFTQVHNEQVYDPSPAIVPLATSLVYDVTTNNAVGATTFVLPVAYVVDQATLRQFAVNRFGASQSSQAARGVSAFDYGQTAVFTGGPGFDASAASTLTLTLQTLAMGTDILCLRDYPKIFGRDDAEVVCYSVA